MLKDIGALPAQLAERGGGVDAEQMLGEVGDFGGVHALQASGVTMVAVVRSEVSGVTFSPRLAAQRSGSGRAG
ncbi:hypothetical protein ACFQU7_01830 [Pseudoroseomonas wenyumeiae]